jgi:hypothetical protein
VPAGKLAVGVPARIRERSQPPGSGEPAESGDHEAGGTR